MIALAISILWFAIGAIVLLGVIWLVLYAIKLFIPVPQRVEQLVWVIVLILVLIAVLGLLNGSGGNISNPFQLHH